MLPAPMVAMVVISSMPWRTSNAAPGFRAIRNGGRSEAPVVRLTRAVFRGREHREMTDTSRRKFLAAAGAGTAAPAVVGLSGGAAQAVPRHRGAATEPVVAYVQNPKAGVLHL